MPWQLYLLISIACFVTLDLIQRKMAHATTYPRAMGVFYNGVVIIFTTLVFLLTTNISDIHLPTTMAPWIYVFAATICYGLFERGRFTAAKLLDLSVNSVISNVSVVIAMVGAFVIYRETFTLEKAVGSLLIICALVLVTYQKTRHDVSTRGVFVSLIIHIALGLGWMLDKKGVAGFGVELYGLMLWTLPFVIIVFPKVPLHELKAVMREKPWLTVVTALLNCVGYFAQLKALAVADATVVIPVLQTVTLLNVVMGIWVLNEKSHVAKKLIGGIVALLGAWLVAH